MRMAKKAEGPFASAFYLVPLQLWVLAERIRQEYLQKSYEAPRPQAGASRQCNIILYCAP
jgi:hypothetical protein